MSKQNRVRKALDHLIDAVRLLEGMPDETPEAEIRTMDADDAETPEAELHDEAGEVAGNPLARLSCGSVKSRGECPLEQEEKPEPEAKPAADVKPLQWDMFPNLLRAASNEYAGPILLTYRVFKHDGRWDAWFCCDQQLATGGTLQECLDACQAHENNTPGL